MKLLFKEEQKGVSNLRQRTTPANPGCCSEKLRVGEQGQTLLKHLIQLFRQITNQTLKMSIKFKDCTMVAYLDL